MKHYCYFKFQPPTVIPLYLHQYSLLISGRTKHLYLYRGDYLSSSDTIWHMSLNTYCTSAFQASVRTIENMRPLNRY